jgi:hypothetical protein
MPLQNRVTPFGDIIVLAHRGTLMGNRGVLHDDAGRIVRSAQVRRWIACVTEFRGRHRAVMQPRRWTELFFLDEATALSAGHRPCAECRYADYQRLRSLWVGCYGGPAKAGDIDERLQADRVSDGKKRTYVDDIGALPDGAYVAFDAAAYLVWGEELLAWSGAGYAHRRPRPKHQAVEILTPRSIVAVLAAGYRPGVHPTSILAGSI